MSAPHGLGIIGWGAAGRLMAAAVERTDRFRLAGVADTTGTARERASRDTGVPVYAGAEQLAAAGGVDVLYVASPTAHHGSAIECAAAHGKHVISEKPLAADLPQARRAVAAARRAGTVLLVGATHGSDAPVRALRRLVEEGELGQLLSVTSDCRTDWHRRPRSAADLDASLGNGLVLRQGAHQFDILRYVCGGLATTVFGTTFGGAAGTERGFSALLAFDGEVHAGAHYTGTGGFDSRLLTWGVGELATFDVEPEPPLDRYFVLPGAGTGHPTRVSPMFGTTVATFTEGGAWLTPRGLLLHKEAGSTEIPVADEPSGWDATLAEMDAALAGCRPVHDGAWGLATLEVRLAVHESTHTGSPVTLRHQVAVGTASPASALWPSSPKEQS